MEAFRQKIISQEAPQEAPKKTEITPTKDLAEPTSEPLKEKDSLSLDVWEGEHKRKYGVDYFDIRNIAHEFPLKANFGVVDKFIKVELENKGYSKTPENYVAVLKQIEQEIGTERMETFKRLQRISDYIKVISKYRALKVKKEQFKL